MAVRFDRQSVSYIMASFTFMKNYVADTHANIEPFIARYVTDTRLPTAISNPPAPAIKK